MSLAGWVEFTGDIDPPGGVVAVVVEVPAFPVEAHRSHTRVIAVGINDGGDALLYRVTPCKCWLGGRPSYQPWATIVAATLRKKLSACAPAGSVKFR